MSIELHVDHFAKGTQDVDWLPLVAAKGWILLTLDTRLRYNKLEQKAILDNGLPVFLIVGGRRHDEKAELFLKARNKIERFLERHRPPFIAKIYANGQVERWLP